MGSPVLVIYTTQTYSKRTFHTLTHVLYYGNSWSTGSWCHSDKNMDPQHRLYCIFTNPTQISWNMPLTPVNRLHHKNPTSNNLWYYSGAKTGIRKTDLHVSSFLFFLFLKTQLLSHRTMIDMFLSMYYIGKIPDPMLCITLVVVTDL